ncbi:UDP-glucose 4-epimerase family protein [Marinobacter halotolerans]|uniref:UDP-glucose 4-epimerase family protein n=1 Tax=Marinobacter halotolerans TaxID=1569211 RepID=UPI001246F3CB|nr:SDR family oxidoreductase [Marinobacter halotolerans]
MKVLLTGATGFVGRELASALMEEPGVALTSAVRRSTSSVPGTIFLAGELNEQTDWASALVGQDVVIHAAARAHVMKDEVADPLAEYRRVNVQGTLNLAKQSVAAGVKRFIFVSSIKVNGEQTLPGRRFTADDQPAPEDAYGLSKLEAEKALQALVEENSMELVIIRPPLVYGPGVKGNFATLVKLVDRGIPLPFGSVHNKRSLIALTNLVDLVITCLDHPAAANQVFLASDGQDLSTTELLRGVAYAMGKPARLVSIPSKLLMIGAGILGKKEMAQRVLGSLQVDITKTCDLLGWRPPLGSQDGLRRCFAEERRE